MEMNIGKPDKQSNNREEHKINKHVGATGETSQCGENCQN